MCPAFHSRGETERRRARPESNGWSEGADASATTATAARGDEMRCVVMGGFYRMYDARNSPPLKGGVEWVEWFWA